MVETVIMVSIIYGINIMVDMVIIIVVVMVVMLIRTDRTTRTQGQTSQRGETGQTDLTLKLDFLGNFCGAAFAILARFWICVLCPCH